MDDQANKRTRSGETIDIVAMPGAVAFRLREKPDEDIYVFTTEQAARFLKELAQMTQHARMLAGETTTKISELLM